MSLLRKATRQRAKIRLGLSGPSGAGKTYTALLLASGMTSWDKIALIDTENGSGDLYAHLGEYSVLPITAPYTPEKYIQATKECEAAGMEVIIIDSITHEWSGKGGCLDIHESETQKMKIPNSFTSWAKVTPRHQAFIDSILQSPCHIITTVRSKTDYVLTEKNGRQVPQKVGMSAVTRDGFEYELTLSFDMDTDHKAFTSKDRTGLFAGQNSFVPDQSTGQKIMQWCESGADPVKDAYDVVNEPSDIQDPTLFNHNSIVESGKPLITNEQFKKLCERVKGGEKEAYWKALDAFSFEATQKNLLDGIYQSLKQPA